jgi:hypothetical protein
VPLVNVAWLYCRDADARLLHLLIYKVQWDKMDCKSMGELCCVVLSIELCIDVNFGWMGESVY